MNTSLGYAKKTLTDSNVLLSGGGDKALSEFIGSLNWDSTNKKLQYKSASSTNFTDLITFGSNAFTSYSGYNIAFQNNAGTTVDTFKALTSPNKTFKAGTNVQMTAANNVITITATDTWTAWKGATDSANGVAGYMPAPTSAQRGQFLRGDGSWVSLNNYSLPTASNTTLGGVKTGAAVTDTTGMTAVHIKDGVIYYKDTNTTYSFSNLQFQQTSGTNLMTYNSQAARTVLAGSNITFTHSNNVLTIAAKDTTYSTVSKTAAGLCPALPNETTTTKYLRQDGTWVTPPNNNTWRGIYVGGASKVGTGTNTLPINFAAGSNVSITYEAAGTGSGQSGNAGYFNVKISATDTKYSDFVKSGSGAKAGLVPAPSTTAGTTHYLREDGTWTVPPNDNTWKAANASQEGYVPKSIANKILRTNADGALYWGNDANTTYTFYNLQFQNSGGTTVDTYKPTTSPTKTLKAGANVTISAASNVITIASTNTWNANAVGVAGYVAAPTKASNANMTWQTDANGNPAWRASNNHSHSYLPLSGANYSTSTDTNPFKISRVGGNNECLSISVNDNRVLFHHMQDETTANFVFKGEWDNSESGDTSKAGAHTVAFNLNYGAASITLDNYTVYHTGNLPAYPTKSSWNYNDMYVASVSISGNNLRINKNGTNTDLTIPYAINSSGADHLNFERVSDIHATTGWRMFTTTNASPSNGPVSGKWMQGLTVLPNNDTNGYRNILAFVDCGSNNELWIQTQSAGSWGNWRKILDSGNSSVSKSGETLTVKINGTSQSLTNTNTWRGMQNNLTTSSSGTSDSLSAYQGYLLANGSARDNTKLPIAQVSVEQNTDTTWGKTYAESHRQSFVYNTSGREWAYWIGMRSSDVACGTILRLSHDGLVQYAHKAGGAAGANWSAWKNIITSDNIGSQSVNYATSAGSANAVAWGNVTGKPSTFTPASHDHNDSYTLIYSGNSSYTFTTLAAAGRSSVGMINPTTDNPTGGQSWVHCWSQTWTKGSTSNWVSQIALATEKGVGMYYRCTSGNIAGRAWYRVIDSNNIGSQSVNYASSAGNADTVDSQHFKWSNDSNSPTYLWAANSSGTAFLCARGSMSVNYANSAGSVAWANVSGKPTLLGAINYNNNSNSTYQMLWGSGNAVYGTAGIYVNPYYNYVYATSFYTTSDRSKKQDISEFSEHIRKFQMKDTKTWHYGVIAQEVPEMFRDGEEGNMTVNYNSVLSYYVGCLENKVKELEEKIKVLETKQNKQI